MKIISKHYNKGVADTIKYFRIRIREDLEEKFKKMLKEIDKEINEMDYELKNVYDVGRKSK